MARVSLTEAELTRGSEMEARHFEQSLSDYWKRGERTCCLSLERDDLRHVLALNSWDDVQKQISQGQNGHQAQREFGMLTPSLMKLRTFTGVHMAQLVPSLDPSILWGMVGLIIKVGKSITTSDPDSCTETMVKLAQEHDATSNRVPGVLRELCYQVEILNGYCAEPHSSTPQLKELAVETGSNLLSLFKELVGFMRSNVEYSTPGNRLINEWQPFANELDATLRSINGSLSRIEILSKLTVQSNRPEGGQNRIASPTALSKQSSQPEEQAKLPCMILPAIRTSRFFDRTDIIQKIEDHFNGEDSTQTFQSLAIHGLGGVGKSSIALKYAENKLRRNELDALFWVYSEKLVSLQQSFTDIAMRLRLPDARPGDHEENRVLVLNWLQTTQCRWLIVYDNAEDIGLIQAHWPAANHGQALITTRNHTFAFEPAHGGLEITTWNAETGSKFLLHLLATDIGNELKDDETASAHELSQKLSGHALAISHMAGLIHRRALSIDEFLKIYNQHPSEMHGTSGNTSINALWDFSFKSLDANSSAILGALCFVAPDSIPQSFFEAKGIMDLPSSLAFCADHFQFSKAIENLLTLALLKRDKISRTYSMHRLVQTSFKYFMGTEKRQQSFNDATVLVSRVFPRRDTAVAQLYLLWERCSLYLQHVLSLKDCFREEKKTDPNFSALQTYCDLNNACQRYLLEISAYTDLEDLIEINSIALATLPKEEQTISLQGSLTSHTGQLFCRLGKPVSGVEWLKKSYDIRSHDVPFNPRESAWASGNAGNGLGTLNEFSEAIKWQEKARDHWLDWSNQQVSGKGEWPATIKIDLGVALVWAGFRQRARDILHQAKLQIESTEPYNWAMAAYMYFALGNLSRHERNYETAEAQFMEAQNAWAKGDQFRTAPLNAACMYRLGCTALDQGKVEAAIKHLRDAKVVTEMHRGKLVAEHARALFKLSEALEQEPRDHAEAKQLREEAERQLRLRHPDVVDPGLERTYDALVYILWR